jgi:hypothetical protein
MPLLNTLTSAPSIISQLLQLTISLPDVECYRAFMQLMKHTGATLHKLKLELFRSSISIVTHDEGSLHLKPYLDLCPNLQELELMNPYNTAGLLLVSSLKSITFSASLRIVTIVSQDDNTDWRALDEILANSAVFPSLLHVRVHISFYLGLESQAARLCVFSEEQLPKLLEAGKLDYYLDPIC